MKKQERNQAKQQKYIGSSVTLLISIFLITSLLSGCATIFSGKHQEIQVKPAGSKIEIYTWDGKLFASTKTGLKTTVTVQRPKLQSLLVRVKKDGYCPGYWLTTPKENPVTHLNMFIGGLIGLLIDIHTGANSLFSPSEFELNMQEAQKCGL